MLGLEVYILILRLCRGLGRFYEVAVLYGKGVYEGKLGIGG